jgi:hypothetical protein
MLLSFLYFKDIGKVHQVRGSGKIAYPIPNRLTIPHFCTSTPTQKSPIKRQQVDFYFEMFFSTGHHQVHKRTAPITTAVYLMELCFQKL